MACIAKHQQEGGIKPPLNVPLGNSEYSLVSYNTCAFGKDVESGHAYTFVRCNHNSDVWIVFDSTGSKNKEFISKRSGISFTLNTLNPFNDDFETDGAASLSFLGIGEARRNESVIAVYERNTKAHAMMEAFRSGDIRYLESDKNSHAVFGSNGELMQDEFGHTADSAVVEYLRRYGVKQTATCFDTYEKMVEFAKSDFAKHNTSDRKFSNTDFEKHRTIVLGRHKPLSGGEVDMEPEAGDVSQMLKKRLHFDELPQPPLVQKKPAFVIRQQPRPPKRAVDSVHAQETRKRNRTNDVEIISRAHENDRMRFSDESGEKIVGTSVFVWSGCVPDIAMEVPSWLKMTVEGLQGDYYVISHCQKRYKCPEFTLDSYKRLGFIFDFSASTGGSPTWQPDPNDHMMSLGS